MSASSTWLAKVYRPADESVRKLRVWRGEPSSKVDGARMRFRCYCSCLLAALWSPATFAQDGDLYVVFHTRPAATINHENTIGLSEQVLPIHFTDGTARIVVSRPGYISLHVEPVAQLSGRIQVDSNFARLSRDRDGQAKEQSDPSGLKSC